MAYGTLATLKLLMGISDASQDAALSDRLEQMADWLDQECERTFTRQPSSGEGVFVFHGNGRRILPVRRGIVSMSVIEYAPGTGQAYTALDSDEWYLDPPELLPEDSYDRIVLSDVATITEWPRGVNTIRGTGVLGYSAAPSGVVNANLNGAAELHRQGPGGGHPVGLNQFGQPLFMQGLPRSVFDALNRYAWRNRDFSSVGTRRD